MATTLTTNNPQGLGYQTGYFSGPQGEPLAQHFFDAAFAGRINNNKIYKQAYHCNLVDECTMSTWMDEIMGYETDCYPAYTLLETYGQLHTVTSATTITLPQYPDTVALHLEDKNFFVGGQFILPQVGNTIVTTPRGVLAKVTAVNLASSGDAIVTIQQRDTTGNTGAQTITAGDSMLVLAGALIEDCACPTGQFAVNDLPIEIDISMDTFGDKGSLCGDALNKCQFLKIPFTDECGNKIEKWWVQALADMYKDHERRKHFENLFNPKWGIIPTITARGMKWTPASTTEITTDDVRSWKAQLREAGISCMEYSIFAGTDLFSQFQRMLLAAGVVKLDNEVHNPSKGCAWINMQYCGIMVEGLTLHIYEECSFGNGKMLGSGTSVFPNSAIVVPMCNRPACTRSTGRGDGGGGDNKMLSKVYFRSLDGRVWDNLTDSDGVLGVRNTKGVGCEEQDWSIKSRYLLEVHCANQWGFMGL
jgi:hypothetical protein